MYSDKPAFAKQRLPQNQPVNNCDILASCTVEASRENRSLSTTINDFDIATSSNLQPVSATATSQPTRKKLKIAVEYGGGKSLMSTTIENVQWLIFFVDTIKRIKSFLAFCEKKKCADYTHLLVNSKFARRCPSLYVDPLSTSHTTLQLPHSYEEATNISPKQYFELLTKTNKHKEVAALMKQFSSGSKSVHLVLKELEEILLPDFPLAFLGSYCILEKWEEKQLLIQRCISLKLKI